MSSNSLLSMRLLGRVLPLAIVGFSFAIPAGAATKLIVTNGEGVFPPPSPTVHVGAAVSVLVLAVDDNGLIDSSFRGAALLASSDPAASIPSSVQFTEVNQGIVAFEIAFNTPGTQTITATDAAGLLLSGSLTLTVFDLSNPCAADPHTLCLGYAGRFQVTSSFRQMLDGGSFSATAVPLTDETGMFWFFEPRNVELVVKVLEGCGQNGGGYWVFAGGLTNVGVELVVTDTLTHAVKHYSSAVGTPFQPIQDSSAFPCP